MGMYHSTSGKAGYAGYQIPCAYKFKLEDAVAVLTAEDLLRASPLTQDAYSQKEDFEWLKKVTVDCQVAAINKVVPGAIEEHGVETMLTALHNLRFDPRIAGDPRYNQLTVYQRCDKSHPGTVVEGGALADAPMTTSSGEEVSFVEYLDREEFRGRPVVVVAGSGS